MTFRLLVGAESPYHKAETVVWNIAARRENQAVCMMFRVGRVPPDLGNAHEEAAKAPVAIGALAQTKRETPVAEAGTEDMS